MTDFQRIFLLSPINGGQYEEPERHKRIWPASTWFRKRLAELKIKELDEAPA
jgi:hypothetical protein